MHAGSKMHYGDELLSFGIWAERYLTLVEKEGKNFARTRLIQSVMSRMPST